jgi:hypothetical protein
MMGFRALDRSHPIGRSSGRRTVLSDISDGLLGCYL